MDSPPSLIKAPHALRPVTFSRWSLDLLLHMAQRLLHLLWTRQRKILPCPTTVRTRLRIPSDLNFSVGNRLKLTQMWDIRNFTPLALPGRSLCQPGFRRTAWRLGEYSAGPARTESSANPVPKIRFLLNDIALRFYTCLANNTQKKGAIT